MKPYHECKSYDPCWRCAGKAWLVVFGIFASIALSSLAWQGLSTWLGS